MSVCVCTHNSKGPGIPESCAKRASVVELPLCLSLCAPFLFPSCSRPGRRGGEDSQGVGRKTEAAFSQLFLSLSSSVFFLVSLSFCLTFTLCHLPCFLWHILFHCSARHESKAPSVIHTHTLTPSSFFQRHSLCHSPEVKSLPCSVTRPQCLSPAIMIQHASSSKVQHCVCVCVCVCLSDPAHFLADLVVIRIRVRLG